MKNLTDLMKEINEYADTLKYDDLKKDYIINVLQESYQNLLINYELTKSDLVIQKMRHERSLRTWERLHPEDFKEEEQEEGISECCGAEIYPDTDICSECKEHC
jgi:hypothetical protein